MPKSTKHKKARVADFAKAKLKLGKGKQIANNATNTSISSRSLALPTQLASVAPTSAPTSRRNLPLPTLLSQTTHHAPALRLLALTEARQLVQEHPYLIKAHAPTLLRALGGLLGDQSAKVRRLTRECFEEVLLHLGGGVSTDGEDGAAAQNDTKGKGKDHGSPLEEVGITTIVYTLSALSSLEEDVRIDALDSLSMLIRVMPKIVVGGWLKESQGEGDKVLGALLGVMRIRALVQGAGVAGSQFTSSANADLSPTARLATLRTLSLFLQSSLSPTSATSSSNTPWYLLPSLSSPRSYYTFLSSLSLNSPSHQVDTNAHSSYSIEPFTFATLPPPQFPLPLSNNTATSSSSPSLTPYHLLKTIHPTLLSTFLDTAPVAFSPSNTSSSTSSFSSLSTNTPLETVLKVMEISKELFWDLLGGIKEKEDEWELELEDSPSVGGRKREEEEVRELLLVLLGYMAQYFPFGGDDLVARGVEIDQVHQNLSLLYSSLVALLVLSSESETRSRRALSGGKKGVKKQEKEEKRKEKIGLMVNGVGEWVSKALKGELSTPTSPISTPFPPSSFILLEPTLWALLNSTDEEVSEGTLEAVIENFSGATGERKKVAFSFLTRVVLITTESTYINRFEVDKESMGPETSLGRWVLSLPRYLWESGKKDEEASELVLTFLLKLARQGSSSSRSILPDSMFLPLLPSLIPFFHLLHPARGAIPGPFTKLSKRLQELALDLVNYFLRSVEEEGGKGLREAVGRAVEGTVVAQRWSQIAA